MATKKAVSNKTPAKAASPVEAAEKTASVCSTDEVLAMATYTAVFAKAEDGSWGGYFPDCATIVVNGDTLEEAQENARTGLEFWIEGMTEDDLPLPVPTSVAIKIEASV